jgi:ABC-type lipoprotein export system ATPase subunit
MENYVFKIKNLKCSYNGNEPVLQAEHLNIPRGKMTMLLGISGSGKSTLLETLGLMNRTLMPDSEIIYCSDNKTYNFNDIWKRDERYVALIRNNDFSFIFQDTNLMPAFTAYENVAVTQMLQGKSRSESFKRVMYFMKIMGLEEVGLNKKASELAGGQKQRLAFVRAITPGFEVLFADEPTGNLDRKNAKEVMRQLSNQVKTLNKSAVIVTHDTALAEEFADQIIVISKSNGIGSIDKENIFYRDEQNNWHNGTESNLNIKTKLKQLLGYDE